MRIGEIAILALILVYQDVSVAGSDVTLYPRRPQKVPEGSPVVITCVCNVPGTKEFSWLKSGRATVVPKRDLINITSIGDNMSVLTIPRTDMKKHRRTYTCVVEIAEAGSQMRSKPLALKILAPSRLHKNFPHVTPSSGFVLARDGSSVSLKCNISISQSSRDAPTWRWIKDGYLDLGLLEDRPGTIIRPTGELYMDEVTSEDSGMYMCVAQNKRGAGYGMPVVLTVTPPETEPEGIDEDKDSASSVCVDFRGEEWVEGSTYRPEVCVTCQCEGGEPSACIAVLCDAPNCTNYMKSEDTCCGYKCIDENTRCIDDKGVVHEETFTPGTDPCYTCMCQYERVTGCAKIICDAPTCPDYELIPGTCCGFICPAEKEDEITLPQPPCIDDKGRMYKDGDLFQPRTSEPCYTCGCVNGSRAHCALDYCDEPPCAEYDLIPNTCCGFVCHNATDVVVNIDGSCRSSNGSYVKSGERYPTPDDPCKHCVCEDGIPTECMAVACMPPPMSACANPKQVPGVCCEFECDGPQPVQDGRATVQQVGPNSALIQWPMPEEHSRPMSKSQITWQTGTYNVYNQSFALLRNLDPNNVYSFTVNSTFLRGASGTKVAPVRFSLDGRATSSLLLNDAVGPVYASRGSVSYDTNGYSLPRSFRELELENSVRVIINLGSFNRIEAGQYTGIPCNNESGCGTLRFYQFATDERGREINVMSLMFESKQDFRWAQAHL